MQRIKKNQYNISKVQDSVAADLIQKLLVHEPNKRLGCGTAGNGFKQLKDHPFFDQVDFKNIYKMQPPAQDIHSPFRNLDIKNFTFDMNKNASSSILEQIHESQSEHDHDSS